MSSKFKLLAIAALALLAARFVESQARQERAKEPTIDRPYAPSAGAAPFVALGYREAVADALSLRLRGYFGGLTDHAATSADLAEAILALDPHYARMYEYGARAITMADHGVGNGPTLRAIALLEQGRKALPDKWSIPYLAGQLYTLELETTNPAERRAWDERGALLIESALRKPGASGEAATFAAHLRTKLGQREAAAAGLREMLLITRDLAARKAMIQKLAAIEEQDAAEIAAEVLGERQRFEERWRQDRPSVTQTMYVVLGPRLPRTFDLTTLASGGRALVGSELRDPVEPLSDE